MNDITTDDQPRLSVGGVRDRQERTTADAAFNASEMRYRRLFEAAHDGILILDPATRKIVEANPFMTRLIGYSHDQLIGMELYEIGFLADAQASQKMFRTLTATRQVRYENLPLQTLQGELREVEVVANLYEEGGHSVVQCNVRDITDRRRAEKESLEHQNFLDGIFKVLPGVLYVFDMDENRVVFINNTAALTFTPEEIAGMGTDIVRNLMHPDDRIPFQEHVARMRTLNPGETAAFEYRMRDKADEWRWYLSTDAVYLRDESGVARQMIGVAPEITERKRAELALQISETRHSLLIGSWAQAVWETDAHGVVIADSPSWRAYTGQTLPEWLGHGWLDAVHPDDRVYAERQWREATAAHGLVNAEFRLRAPGGGWRWTNVRAAPVLDARGNIEKWAGMNIDIEARKRAEAVLRETEERQAFLLKLSDAIRLHGDPLEIQSAALRVLGEHLAVNRAFYNEIDEDRDAYVIHRTYADGVAPLTGRFRLSDLRWTAELAGSGQIVVFDDAGTDPRLSVAERASYAAMDVAAGVGVPLIKDGRWVASLGVHHAEPRHWTPEDLELVRETAERTWAAVERARVEAALHANEYRFRTLIEATSAVTWSCAPSGMVVEFQPQWSAFTGQSASEMLGGGHAAAFHPDDADNASARWADAVARDATYYNELRIRRHDGEWRWMRVHCVPVHQNGVIVEWFGMCIDITERKQAETALRESEGEQRFLLELSDALRAEPSAEAIANRALRMLFEQMRLDRCYIGIYRLAEDIGELPYQLHDERLPPLPSQVRLSDFPEALRIAFDRTLVIDDVEKEKALSDNDRASFTGLDTGALISATLRKGENKPLWAVVASSACARVWTKGEVSLVEEVAERTWAAMERASAEAALHAAQDTFRQLVDRSPFGIYTIDADFRLAQISIGAQKVFENVQPAIGRDLAEVQRILWPEPFASEAIARFRHTLATGEAHTEESTERRADTKASEAYDWKLERITMPDGRFGVVCHFYDLSERNRHEEHAQLLMAEVNHRAKNLLSVVQAVAQQTASSGDPLTFAARLSDRIGGLSANQDLLVKNLWHGVEVSELVTSQLAHFRDLIGTRIHLDGPGLMVTAAASQAIGMAVHELATNAAKYGALSNSNGQVRVEWQLTAGADSRFVMSWRESDGPRVTPPTRKGFGQTVIKRLVETSVEGSVEMDYAEDGFSWQLGTAAENVLVMPGGKMMSLNDNGLE